MGRGQRHTTDAVLDHCSLQARLWMYCVWHSIAYQYTTTWEHPQRWTKTGTSQVSSIHTETNEAPLEQPRLKLFMNYYLKTRACIDNLAHHALQELEPTTRDLYLSKPNGKCGMTRSPTQPIGLKVEEALTSAEIDTVMVCPLKIPNFPYGKHEYDPKRHSLVEGVSKCMITREEARAKFN